MSSARRPLLPALGLLLVLVGCSGLSSGTAVPAVSAAGTAGDGGSGTIGPTEPGRPPAPGASTPGSAAPDADPTTPPSAPSTALAPSTAPATAATATTPATAATAATGTNGIDGTLGSIGIGDPYYPRSGNGGYQVDSYDVNMQYDPGTNVLQAQTTITGSITSPSKLGRFDLDLQPTMTVRGVLVNGRPATFAHRSAELVITPSAGLPPGSTLTVVVGYDGNPGKIPGGSAGGSDGGWYRTAAGGALAIGEPFSASAWYPVNEHPADTAAFSVSATVPSKWKVISNGVAQLTGLPAAPAGRTTFRWVQREPIASYLTTIYIDTFSTVTDQLADGRPIVSAFAPVPDRNKFRILAQDTRRIVDDLTGHFGRYPFDAVGGIYTGEPIAFALETTTRPVYASWAGTDTIVHELAHQWYGDDVAIERWADICLAECFASYAPWLWHADVDHTDLDQKWVQQMSQEAPDPGFWASPLVDMGSGNEFTAVYARGPLALHALRKEIGETTFAALLKDWPRDFSGKHATFDEWESYVNALAGRNLSGFIDAWFRGTVVPPSRYRHPGGLGR